MQRLRATIKAAFVSDEVNRRSIEVFVITLLLSSIAILFLILLKYFTGFINPGIGADLQILRYFNDLPSRNKSWFNFFDACGDIEMIRSIPVIACLIYVSFSNSSAHVKSKILLGLFGACLALITALYCQAHLHLHLRPVFDESLHISNLLKWNKSDWGKRLYSFPSDTATVFFALCSIVFFQSKKLGVLCFLWILLTVGLSRVALGVHYPSDIIGGFILAFTLIYALSQMKFVQTKIEILLMKYDPKFTVFNFCVVLFCIEAYSLFPSVQKLLHL